MNTVVKTTKAPKAPKRFRITCTKYRAGRDNSVYTHEGTVEELVKVYSYTLECGESWQHEKGNKKINRNPKNIASLVKNIENAKNNSASNGYSGESYTFVEL